MALWVYGLLIVLAALVALFIWSSWRDRTVDFLHDVPLGAYAETARERLLDREVPILVAADFKTAADVAHTTILERRGIPGWAYVLAVLFFPVGLLALLARHREAITIASSDGFLRVHGCCGKTIADQLIHDVDDVAGVFRTLPSAGA